MSDKKGLGLKSAKESLAKCKIAHACSQVALGSNSLKCNWRGVDILFELFFNVYCFI